MVAAVFDLQMGAVSRAPNWRNPVTSRTKRSRLAITAIAAATALIASGCGSSDDAASVDGINLVAADTLTTCTHLPYKPFEFTDDDGKVVGFDVSMLDLLADSLGIKQEVVDIEWSQITSGAAFAADKCEAGFGAMTITDERAEAVDFSDPYFDATQALLVRTEDGYADLSDLDGMKLGVQTDTTGQIYAEDNAEEFGYDVVVYDDSITEFEGVRSGKVAAAINDNAPLYEFVKSNDDTEVTAEFDTGEQYGFAFVKDDENAGKLIDKFNEALAAAKDDGTYDDEFEKWFGKLPAEVNK